MCFVSLVRMRLPMAGRRIQRLLGRDGTAQARGVAVRLTLGTGCENLVHQTIRYRIFGRHEVVTLGVYGDALDGLAGVLGQDAVQALAQVEDFASLDLDIGGLPLGAARGLVDRSEEHTSELQSLMRISYA